MVPGLFAGSPSPPTSNSYYEVLRRDERIHPCGQRGLSQYAGLSLALGVAVTALYALALRIRSKIGKQKWIWLIPMLVGLLRVAVNRTSSQWMFTPLAIQIPPVHVAVEAYGPWQIILHAPVGAIAFLLYCRRLPKAITNLSLAQPPTLDQPADAEAHLVGETSLCRIDPERRGWCIPARWAASVCPIFYVLSEAWDSRS
jgi:hypothetical protein